MLKDWHPDIGSDGSLPLQCIAVNPRLSSNFAVKQIFPIPGVYLHIAVSLSPLSNNLAREMVQWLETLAVLPEDLSSVLAPISGGSQPTT